MLKTFHFVPCHSAGQCKHFLSTVSQWLRPCLPNLHLCSFVARPSLNQLLAARPSLPKVDGSPKQLLGTSHLQRRLRHILIHIARPISGGGTDILQICAFTHLCISHHRMHGVETKSAERWTQSQTSRWALIQLLPFQLSAQKSEGCKIQCVSSIWSSADPTGAMEEQRYVHPVQYMQLR